jgi:hypothetical protein
MRLQEGRADEKGHYLYWREKDRRVAVCQGKIIIMIKKIFLTILAILIIIYCHWHFGTLAFPSFCFSKPEMPDLINETIDLFTNALVKANPILVEMAAVNDSIVIFQEQFTDKSIHKKGITFTFRQINLKDEYSKPLDNKTIIIYKFTRNYRGYQFELNAIIKDKEGLPIDSRYWSIQYINRKHKWFIHELFGKWI